jgi:autotransporter adhesin
LKTAEWICSAAAIPLADTAGSKTIRVGAGFYGGNSDLKFWFGMVNDGMQFFVDFCGL